MRKLLLSSLEGYREVIIEMMRYSGAVDQIADDLNCSEEDLVEYIKSSGIDKQLSRRSWKWKVTDKGKRRVIGSS